MKTKPDYYYRQSAVIPYRKGSSGLQVLVITSRRERRWIVPKGIVEPDLDPPASAAKEAFEEAGIAGRVLPEPIGSYAYDKWGGTCQVDVYAMAVDKMLDNWPESFRRREWVDLREAAARLEEPALKGLLARLPKLALK